MIEISVIFLVIFLTLVGISLHIFGMPGNFVVLLGAILASFITGWEAIPLLTIMILSGIVVAGEVLDLILSSLLAKGGGASFAGIIGGIIGGFAGAIVGFPLPVVGNVAGAFAGAFLGSVLFEWFYRGELKKAFRAGSLVLLGRLISSPLKIGIGLGVGFYTIISLI